MSPDGSLVFTAQQYLANLGAMGPAPPADPYALECPPVAVPSEPYSCSSAVAPGKDYTVTYTEAGTDTQRTQGAVNEYGTGFLTEVLHLFYHLVNFITNQFCSSVI